MTSTTTAQSTSKDNASAALIEATIVIRIVSPVQAEAAIRSRAASARWAHLDQRDPYQLYRRVFVPSAELLCENLPEPEI